MLVLLVLTVRAQVALPGFSKACMVMNQPHGGGVIIGVRKFVYPNLLRWKEKVT